MCFGCCVTLVKYSKNRFKSLKGTPSSRRNGQTHNGTQQRALTTAHNDENRKRRKGREEGSKQRQQEGWVQVETTSTSSSIKDRTGSTRSSDSRARERATDRPTERERERELCRIDSIRFALKSKRNEPYHHPSSSSRYKYRKSLFFFTYITTLRLKER